MSDDFITIQEEFMDAIEEISYLQPELAFEIADRIRHDSDFYFATGRIADEFLLTVLERRGAEGITTNLYIYGYEGHKEGTRTGATQVGKSIASIIIAFFENPKFSLKQVMFDFTELDRKLPKTKIRTRYLVDDVRNRLTGTGAKAELERIIDFMETNAEAGISLTICSPSYHAIADIHYRIEMLGHCPKYSLGIIYGRGGKPVGWIRFAIPDNLKQLIIKYRKMKKEFREGIKRKGAGRGYVSGKIAELIEDIEERGLEFESPKKLRRFLTLEYDHWIQKVQEAAYAELKEIMFPDDKESIPDTIEVAEGQEFRDFLFDYLPPSTIRSIIELYYEAGISRQDEVAKELKLDSAARVSEQISRFTERELGGLFEIWYNKGGKPAPEGKVDAFEDEIPVNLKATYSSRKKLRIPVEKMKPELEYALTNNCPVRIRAYNLFFDKMLVEQFNPKDIMKRGVAVVNFG